MNLQEQQIAVHMGVVINEYLTDAVIAGNERQLWKLLQNLFRMALQSDLLKSELYLQLVKQSNGNPEARQVERLLRLLHMVVIAIPCPEVCAPGVNFLSELQSLDVSSASSQLCKPDL